jgi:hypothetical protein
MRCYRRERVPAAAAADGCSMAAKGGTQLGQRAHSSHRRFPGGGRWRRPRSGLCPSRGGQKTGQKVGRRGGSGGGPWHAAAGARAWRRVGEAPGPRHGVAGPHAGTAARGMWCPASPTSLTGWPASPPVGGAPASTGCLPACPERSACTRRCACCAAPPTAAPSCSDAVCACSSAAWPAGQGASCACSGEPGPACCAASSAASSGSSAPSNRPAAPISRGGRRRAVFESQAGNRGWRGAAWELPTVSGGVRPEGFLGEVSGFWEE